jgi:hypothetical protein
MLPPRDARTLDDLAQSGHTRFFLTCEKCGRTGNHSLSSLIGRFGVEQGITGLLAELSRDCPQRAEIGVERCGVAYQLTGNSSRRPRGKKRRLPGVGGRAARDASA